MTDLEMTKACARAMGWRADWTRPDFDTVKAIPVEQFPGAPHYQYMPLRSDSDAMALVKKFSLSINGNDDGTLWEVTYFNPNGDEVRVDADDLNRAIVECVAKMQESK